MHAIKVHDSLLVKVRGHGHQLTEGQGQFTVRSRSKIKVIIIRQTRRRSTTNSRR